MFESYIKKDKPRSVLPQAPAPPQQTAEPPPKRYTFSDIIIGFCWIVVLLAACLAAILLVFGMASAGSAPQQAVVASLAVAIIVIPYCFARAVTELLA